MFLDAAAIRGERSFEAHVCVVGAGAAGIPLALSLGAGGLDVVLLEGGGLEAEPGSQALYDAESTGAPYPVPTCRLRQLGGTTGHWGGTTRPLDAFELEAHDWVPESGWPLSRRDLDPWYARAATVLDLPRPDFAFDPAERGAAGLAPLLGDANGDFETVVWRRSQPRATRLGDKYRGAIRDSRRVRCILHANATELRLDEGGAAVSEVRATSLAGARLRVRARRFVLATGAIENARLLLDSDRQIEGGIGNRNGLVGRYFSDHAFQVLGWVLVSNAPDTWLREERFLRGAAPPGQLRDDLGFATTPAFRTANHTLGFSMLAGPFDRIDEAGPHAEAVRDLTAGPEGLRVARPKGRVSQRPEADLRLIGLLGVAEQSPNRESRVTLSSARNAVGSRTAVLHHALRDDDWRSLRESLMAFGIAVAKAGHARARLAEPSERWILGRGGHHSGTTRMADDPKRGVTDRDGKVHGTANLFVAGGSLFPTAGYAHPTLTIVALALRTAAHLETLAKRSR